MRLQADTRCLTCLSRDIHHQQAVDCVEHPLLCSYHGLTRFPPPAVLFFDRTRERSDGNDKAYRKITLPPRVRAKPFMRGIFLKLVGQLDDPYQEWETWDNNGAIVHISPKAEPAWEVTHSDAVVVLFGASISAAQQIQLAAASETLLEAAGVVVVAINCEDYDEICVYKFKPYSFPALYAKQGGEEWKGYRGAIDAAAITAWAAPVSRGSEDQATATPQQEL